MIATPGHPGPRVVERPSPVDYVKIGQSMRTYKIHEDKPQLFRLVWQVANGELFVIAKAGNPLANVMARDAPAPSHTQRFG